MEMASASLTRVTLELGGNDAAVILKDAILDDTHLDRLFAAIYDTTGQPTITLPAGLDANASPIGFQIVGRHFEEALLCRAGMTWQCAGGVHEDIPPLAA